MTQLYIHDMMDFPIFQSDRPYVHESNLILLNYTENSTKDKPCISRQLGSQADNADIVLNLSYTFLNCIKTLRVRPIH